ncbi:MAG: hypothetical protein A3G18_06455 [Rhodospirillales bacterium RIFCSPLOWO2_12_FULL_58_28]|nr:MAG: hypothetical protein A3H92_02030 [Rhodospirillales bacterium RIFCSPLOWO2_02_FULL_58_16]OHC78626.1 MAG: hypothetical protein A3G18_06455 [Rhodospirillales bacterium RIFCSPLOWO2_12_FULL_58_28]
MLGIIDIIATSVLILPLVYAATVSIQEATAVPSDAPPVDNIVPSVNIQAEADARLNEWQKATFLANMNHELRTPLNAIIGFSEMIKHGYVLDNDYDHTMEYGTHIHNAAIHLLSLIEDLLYLSEGNVEKLERQEGEVSIGAILNSVASATRVSA